MTTRRSVCTLAVLVCTLGFAPSRAEAAFITFTTLASWTTAVGPSDIEDFNGFAADESFKNVIVALNGMTVTGTTGVQNLLSQKIDVPPVEFFGYDLNGTSQLLGDIRTSSQFIRFNFTAPLTAWSTETLGIGDSGRLTTLSVYNSADVLLGSILTSSPDELSLGFYGFQLTGGDQAAYLTITNSLNGNDGFVLDNIRFSAAPQTGAPVPEPATVALFASGLAAIALIRRRRS